MTRKRDIAKQAQWTRANEQKRIAQGARRMPGGMLTPEGAQALDELMQRGAPSRVAAINAALVAAAQTGPRA